MGQVLKMAHFMLPHLTSFGLSLLIILIILIYFNFNKQIFIINFASLGAVQALLVVTWGWITRKKKMLMLPVFIVGISTCKELERHVPTSCLHTPPWISPSVHLKFGPHFHADSASEGHTILFFFFFGEF